MEQRKRSDAGSNQFGESPKTRHRLSQALSFKSGEILINVPGSVIKDCPVPRGGSTDDIRCQVELECQEVVGMLCFDAIGPQFFFRKILEIESHDEVGTSADRRSQNMSVVRVRQRDGIDQCLVAKYKAIADMGVHQVAGPLKLFRLQVRTVFKNVSRPLIVNGVGPFAR